MEAQPRGATVIYMCVDVHNYPSGRRVLQYKNGQYTACWSCAARSYFNQITINYIYTQKKRQKKHSLLMIMHCAPNVSVKCCQFMFLEFLEQSLPRFQNSFVRVGCMSSVNEYIYVISDSGVPQRYSLAQNDWQCGSKLPNDDQEILVYMTAVSMGSKIYVLHGCYRREDGTNSRREKPAVVHCFDPLKNVWLKKASTLYPHFNSTLFVDNNKLYVADGWDTVPNESSGYKRATGGAAPVEVYNEESNSWYVVKQNRIPSNTLGAVELLGGKVYFIINKLPIDSGIRIPPNEVYKISLREWENSLERIDRTAVLCYLSVKKEMLSRV